MSAARAVEWSLSADGRTLTVEYETPRGIATGTCRWAFDPSPELVALAVDSYRTMDTQMTPGNRLRMRRLGPVVFESDTGPPTWWLPHFSVHRRPRLAVRIGWLRLAVGIWRWDRSGRRA